jgi:hypothetical protein
MKGILVNLRVSQVSVKSRVTPGEYEDNPMGISHNDKLERQFSIND